MGASRRDGGIARNLDREAVLAGSLETAGSFWGKFMGLMGRAHLDADAGLWLPESNGIHMMFMRFPIDAVFVSRPDADGVRRVRSIHRFAARVDRAGAAGARRRRRARAADRHDRRHRTQVGDRVEIREVA